MERLHGGGGDRVPTLWVVIYGFWLWGLKTVFRFSPGRRLQFPYHQYIFLSPLNISCETRVKKTVADGPAKTVNENDPEDDYDSSDTDRIASSDENDADHNSIHLDGNAEDDSTVDEAIPAYPHLPFTWVKGVSVARVFEYRCRPAAPCLSRRYFHLAANPRAEVIQ